MSITDIDVPPDVGSDTTTRRRATVARRGLDEGADDRAVIEAIRNGDHDAFGSIYRRHHAPVMRLARRLARHRSEADDIVGDVFAGTFRAIVAGRGPTDDALPYLLRSVRNTATSLHTRGDGARSNCTATDTLERLAPPSAADDHDHLHHDDVAAAFRDLPDRFRTVLWATEIDGSTPAELAGGAGGAGAVASLSHRARSALRRSYLSVSTRRRCVDASCRSLRATMPGVVLGDASATTIDRVSRHTVTCAECAAVFDQMEQLARHMPSRSLLGLLLAFVRNFGGVAASLTVGAAPIVLPAAVATLATATIVATDVIRDTPNAGSEIAVVSEFDRTITADPTTAPIEVGPDAVTAAPVAPERQVVDTTADRLADGAKTAPAAIATTSPPGVAVGGSDPTVAPVAPIDGAVDSESLDEPVGQPPLVDPAGSASGALGSTIDTLDDVVDGLGETIDQTVAGVVDGVTPLLEPVTGTVDEVIGEVVGMGTTVLEPVIEPVVDAVTPLVDPVVETVDEVTEELLGTTVDEVVEIVPTTVPSTSELVDQTTRTLTGVTSEVSDPVGGLLGR